ncbi:hypothetical protein V8C37DRAFT_376203 [Trichoderma ceciliae]
MGFLGIYRAIYDYTPNEDVELAIKQGDLLYILEKNDDDGWWKAKKKAGTDDEDEPSGLVPNNYVQKAEAVGHARAIYEYTRQTDEELSLPEDAVLEVFDTSDEDWILAGLDGEYGFVPANYIEVQSATPASAPPPSEAPVLPRRPPSQSIAVQDTTPPSDVPIAVDPAAAIASVIQNRRSTREPLSIRFKEPQLSDEESIRSPALPSRPRPQSRPFSTSIEPPSKPERSNEPEPERRIIPGGFHLYNVNEMVSVMGKKKKMPTTLGINLLTGNILIAPERAQDDPPQEWSADKMTHYSREGKHVFMELVRPSKSIDFHAGAKDTAEEIVAALGELAGAARAEGLREVILAGSQKRQRKGTVLYDFMAQGEDEVTVAAGDEVAIIDDSRSEDWWQVRRLKNGKEGVIPSSYIEFSGTITPPLLQSASTAAGSQSSAKSTVDQNRVEELRLTKEAIKASKEPQQVGPGMLLPRRGSSLIAPDDGNNLGQQRHRRENGRNDGGGHSASKAKPDASKARTWTDRSKSFSVEAQFLGLKDGKLHLHKMNGVKIAVPIAKMSREDLEYVENITGISLDDERPLADVKRTKPPEQQKTPAVGASVDKSQARPEYDWFQFFLSCNVAVGLCERYAQAFSRDSMDESVLPDVDAGVLRNLGLREGDIIKVMRTLDAKFGRDRGNKVNGDTDGGLFSGPGGALRNNTRKGRPAPAVQTGDVVDAAVFSTKETSGSGENATKPASPASPAIVPKRPAGGFDDDAWDVKPTKQEQQTQVRQEPQHSPPAETPSSSSNTAPVPVHAALTGSLKELSLLTTPLEPSKAEPVNLGGEEQAALPAPAPAPPPQPLLGASPSFFSTVPQPNQVVSAQPSQAALTGVHISPKSLARQRPIPPSISPPVQGSLVVPPPPQRPLSAPQSTLPQGMFPAPTLVPQVTGLVQGQVAPQGQSLHDLTQARLQQQQYNAHIQNLQPMLTGYLGSQPQGLNQFSQGAPGQYLQPMITGAPGYIDPSRMNQFAGLQPQQTGFQPGLTQSPFGPGSINNYLPPPLQPQPTGFQSLQPLQPAGTNELKPPTQPLLPQKTGPPPPVRFGVTPEAKKLTPQPTGRRANLAQATPENPFGF